MKELQNDLEKGLYRKRMLSYGGLLKQKHKILNLDDAEDDNTDLVHINNNLNPSLAWLICRYKWNIGVYNFAGSFIESPESHRRR